jgi:hypothetical protein
MTVWKYHVGWRAAKLAVIAGLVGFLGACEGIKPMNSIPIPDSELDPSKPGIFSGDDGAIILYEKK